MRDGSKHGTPGPPGSQPRAVTLADDSQMALEDLWI